MNQPTWSDILEKVRKEVGDESVCEHPAPYELLNSPFSMTNAAVQFRKYCMVEVPGALDAVAWSKDFVYVLIEDHSCTQIIVAVRRNPPK